MTIRFIALAAMLLLGACATLPVAHEKEGDEKGKADSLLFSTYQDQIPHVVVKEAWVSTAQPEDNVDSPASWLQGGKLMVAATAKSIDQLIVYDGDTGVRLRTVGGAGKALGQLNRPNGIATIDDRYAFVVERDNHRVQMFALPDFQPLLAFAEADLAQPYGLWVRKLGDGYEVIVSDNYTLGEDANGDDIIPPLAALDRRFRRYDVGQADGKWKAQPRGHFGDTSEAGAIRITESVFGDEANQRLLIAEEDVSTGTRLREYTLEGKYAGRDVGAGNYRAQAEGIALMRCRDGSGWWVASDQFDDRTVFHLFDRRTLEHAGSFVGNVTGLTDGVWLEERGDARFPQGVFYASHLDVALSAFDWRDITAALKLPACER
ncbi:phytase [Pseudoxanthomonas gei]|uniref:Phytase n=1 Tax=Pseudoxanthomonas gei TaxID=1383030 RepID=A0ABX0AFH3_9GAMM|nr:phytase [Pseudoxanthomonas gei]NDK39618.1 phytase [Pseudoxanthomonas gei]